jgi:hypothetical protein
LLQRYAPGRSAVAKELAPHITKLEHMMIVIANTPQQRCTPETAHTILCHTSTRARTPTDGSSILLHCMFHQESMTLTLLNRETLASLPSAAANHRLYT